jgi:hypothetical protein
VGIVLQVILGAQASGPLQEAFVANTYCTGTTAQLELSPGGFGGGPPIPFTVEQGEVPRSFDLTQEEPSKSRVLPFTSACRDCL